MKTLTARWPFLAALITALALAVTAIAASTRTTLGGSYLEVMSKRELPLPCTGYADQPSADVELASCYIDRKAYLKGFSLVVARRRGTSGNTTAHLQVNGTTVLSSSVSVAYLDAAYFQPGRAAVVLDRNLNAGDIVSLRTGAVTGGTSSRGVRLQAEIVERF